jgi:phage/plasmid-like protein (TIGR03299 family)
VRDVDQSVLGIVGSDYVPFQNRDAFNFYDNLVDSGEAKYETAGSLRGGKWVWLTAKVPQHISIGGVDDHEVYLLLSTSHDGSRAITVSVTPVRVVCSNTLNFALRGAKRRWSVRHISTASERLGEARDTIGLTFKYIEEFQTEAERMLGLTFTEKDMDRFLEELLDDRPRKEKVKSTIMSTFLEAPNLENVRGTQWAAVNAVGEYMDWLRDPRTPESQVISIWNGSAMQVKDKARKLLVTM